MRSGARAGTTRAGRDGAMAACTRLRETEARPAEYAVVPVARNERSAMDW